MSRNTCLAAAVLLVLLPVAAAHMAEHKPGGFESPELQKGDRWSLTLEQAGDVAYHCHPHPYMEGTVRVTSTGEPREVEVRIQNFIFVPNMVEVPAGSTIVWTNEDEAMHQVVESQGHENVRHDGHHTTPAPLAVGFLTALGAALGFTRRR
jgi:plastocyanin